jgi:hypothetical protein
MRASYVRENMEAGAFAPKNSVLLNTVSDISVM